MHTFSAPKTHAVAAEVAARSGLKPSACTDTTLHQLARLVRRRYDVELGKVGLRTTQYGLLTEVAANGPMRPCDLADAMALSPSTLTRNLKPLISSGLLELGPGTDGRTRSVKITASGRSKCAEGLLHWTAAQARVHQLIGSRNVSTLRALVEDCLASMSASA
ncbi:MarR family winged helix-turn-helix transcriptional regulator [Variovorax sp. J22G21]|uniref:MarR family winged helix-turn-helix transcriptional regulator n=1 Tax=Variovorax fucosicus TaxID=3053517 RepID=UPI0025775647|nr:MULTISPECIES: MarR family winged helix-turn-helix transcriptional regulator [unclassified Variovorax]MDM0041236.1 MarR family winged helix-turn-helix transcriptional regulator [Variovorax sp. J22R193]MDM0060293.1 MarR family winged helix-turn-helix transcriptional regulator [Variovorax sp. J22G21]